MGKKTRKRPADYLKGLFSNPFTLLWLCGLFAMIVASLVPQAGLSEMETGFGRDKVARVITFLLLSFYPVAFFPSIRMGLIISTFIAPLGFLLEVFQKYVPGRNFSPEDMIANNIGAIIGILLAIAIRFYFRTGQLKFRKKGGVTPRAALAPEKNTTPSRENETKNMKDPRPRRFKKWRSKAAISGLLIVLGYVGWTIMADQTHRKKPTEIAQPASKASLEQPVIEAEPKLEMMQPDPNAPPLEKEISKNKDLISTVFPNAPHETVAFSEPEPKTPTSEVHGLKNVEQGAIPPTNVPSPEISPSTLTTTPEPKLMEVPDINEGPSHPNIGNSIEVPESQSLLEKKPDTIPEISGQEPTLPQKAETRPDKKTDPAETTVITKSLFSIRAGAFLEKQNAEKLVMDLKAKGYHPYLFVGTDKKNRTWYAVQLSDYTDLDQAGIAAAIFRKKEKKRVYITHKDSLKTVPGLLTR